MVSMLQTLNKGKINAGYLNNSTEKVSIGNLTIPTDKFLRFAMELIRNRNSQKSLNLDEREIIGVCEYKGMPHPAKVTFGDYEIRGGEFGSLVDRLLYEGYLKERENQ